MARCPAHEDSTPSLSVGSDEEKILIKCFAGCENEAVVNAMGLKLADLYFNVRSLDSAHGEPVAVYQYVHADETDCFQQLRFEDAEGKKAFRVRHWDRELDEWVWNLQGCERPLYHLPEVLAAKEKRQTIYVTEGEKDADAFRERGFVATTNPLGAGKWRAEHTATLRGADTVIIVADRDEAGHEHATEVAEALTDFVNSVEIIEAAVGKDAFDHFDAGLSIDEFVPYVPAPPLNQILATVAKFIQRFVILDDHQTAAVSLWVAHCWAIDAAYTTPYIHASSAEEESGKTRLLEVLQLLAPEPILAADITEAALYRVIDDKRPTLFLDEIDAVFSKANQKDGTKDAFRSILNAGYRRGLRVYRAQQNGGAGLDEFEVFCPKALAGLGQLPRTLASRCIRIEMKRRAVDEPVEDFYPEDLQDETQRVKGELLAWREGSMERLTGSRPQPIPGLRDRINEVWRSLLSIASLASPSWEERARNAAKELAKAGSEPSWGMILLEDCRTVFTEHSFDKVSTIDLIGFLQLVEESPWKEEFDSKGAARKLARLLKPYGIKPNTIRIDEQTAKGYKQEDFRDAWKRLLPPPPQKA